MNKAKSGRDETDLSKIEFGMVIDKIEQRDYDIRDLTGKSLSNIFERVSVIEFINQKS